MRKRTGARDWVVAVAGLLIAFGLGAAVGLSAVGSSSATPPSPRTQASAADGELSPDVTAPVAATQSSGTSLEPSTESEGNGHLIKPPPHPGAIEGADESWEEERRQHQTVAERLKDLNSRYPLPLNRKSFVTRGYFCNGIFNTVSGFTPRRILPDALLKYYSATTGKKLPDHKRFELLDRLWMHEEERAEVLQHLYQREEEIIDRLDQEGKAILDAESWIVRRNKLYVIRNGDDKGLSDDIANLNDIEKRRAELVKQFLEDYGN